MKENIKAPCYCPLWGEFTSDRWILHTKGELNTENVSIWWCHRGLWLYCCLETNLSTDRITLVAHLEIIRKHTLQWRHNGHDTVSNHQPHDYLLSRLFRCGSKKTSKLRVTSLCAGISPGTSEFPAQMASNAENVSIWRCHYDSQLKNWHNPSKNITSRTLESH